MLDPQSPKYKHESNIRIDEYVPDLTDEANNAPAEDVSPQVQPQPKYFKFEPSLIQTSKNNNKVNKSQFGRFSCDVTPMRFPPLLSTRSIKRYQDITSPTKKLLINNEITDLTVDQSQLLSMWSAGFTIVNIYLGLGLLSFPYALFQGGFLSLIILAIVCIFMSWTAKILVRCFNQMKPSKKTYPDVGYAAFRTYGIYFISSGIIFEFFGVICTNCLFMWNNVKYGIDTLQFADSEMTEIGNISKIALFCSIATLPTCWVLNFYQMPFVSFLGCICKIVTVLSVVICFVLNIDQVKDNISNNKLSLYPNDGLHSLSICIGIYILSFAGHPVLPGVYNAMREPEKFEILVDRCFMCLFVIYSIMALFGYMQFAENTGVIITQNMANMQGEKVIVSQILIAFIVCAIYFQISPLLSILGEIPEMLVFEIKNQNIQRVFRTALFLFCAGFAYLVMEKLDVLEAITGSVCTMMTSVIGPALFYFAIYTNYISSNMRVWLIFCALIGIICAVIFLFNDLNLF